MSYTTIAVRPETKRRLERLRRMRGLRSMDELARVAAHELETQALAAEIRRAAPGWRRAKPDPRDEEFEAALDGLDATVRAVRKGARKRLGRHARP